ncbi:MAG: GtrA family protein [Paludibacter sp.]|nr:GtrA family protein [Paludibacter sp.]
MKDLLTNIGTFIRKVIDFFYPTFRKYIPHEIFLYGVTGAINLVFDWVIFFLIFNCILHQQLLHLGFVTFSSYIATFVIKFPITLLSGFFLQKYVTFSDSTYTKGRVQLLRYFEIVVLNIVVYYFGLKFFVETIRLFPSIANIVVSIITSAVGYLGQKFFTFKN